MAIARFQLRNSQRQLVSQQGPWNSLASLLSICCSLTERLLRSDNAYLFENCSKHETNVCAWRNKCRPNWVLICWALPCFQWAAFWEKAGQYFSLPCSLHLQRRAQEILVRISCSAYLSCEAHKFTSGGADPVSGNCSNLSFKQMGIWSLGEETR